MADLVLSIRLTADGKALVGEVRGSAEELKKLGQAAGQSNDKARSATEQFIASLKRQADTLGMTKTQTLAYEASQHKLTDAQRDGVAQSIKAIDTYDRQEAMLGRVRTATLAFAAAAAVAGQQFVSMIFSQIEAIANYKRLAEVAGTTAERFSGMEAPARLAGTSLDSVAASVAFLGKSLGDARLGDVSKTSLFRALGIDPKDGRDAAEVMVDLAKSISSMNDQAVAGKVAGDLLGRSYAELRPFMKNLAEQGELVARTTNKDAQEADLFQANLSRLSLATQQAGRALARDFLPFLSNVVEELVRGQKEGGLFAGILAGYAAYKGADDRSRNSRDLVELTDRQLQLENKLMALRSQPANIGGAGQIIRRLQRELDEVNASLKTTLAYRTLLDDAEAARSGGKAAVGASAPSGAGSGDAEARVRERMEFEKHYQERVAAAQGFAERYAVAINLGNALAQEAGKQGLLKDFELIRQVAANEDARLQVLVLSLQQQQALHQKMGDLAQARAAQEKIASAEAARAANDAIAQARLTSLDAQLEQEAAARAERSEKDRAQKVANIQLENMTELELLSWHLEQKKELLDAWAGQDLQRQQIAKEQIELLETQHQAKLGDATAQGILRRRQLEQQGMTQQAAFYFGYLAQITAAGAQHNRTLFNLNKAAGIANAIISTAQGMAEALKWGFPLGPIFAAIIGLAGAVQIQTIRKTEFGGGTSAPSIGGGSAIPVTPASGTPEFPISSAPPPTLSQAGAPRTQINLTLVGVQDKPNYTYDEVVNGLIPILKEAGANGAIKIDVTFA